MVDDERSDLHVRVLLEAIEARDDTIKRLQARVDELLAESNELLEKYRAAKRQGGSHVRIHKDDGSDETIVEYRHGQRSCVYERGEVDLDPQDVVVPFRNPPSGAEG